MIRLKVLHNQRTLEYVFHRSRVRVGRSPMNDLTIPALGVAAHHGTFTLQNTSVVYDPGPNRNETSLQRGQTMQSVQSPTPLQPGDLLVLGGHVQVHLLEAPNAARLEVVRRSFLSDLDPGPLGVVFSSTLASISLRYLHTPDLKALLNDLPALIESATPCEVVRVALLCSSHLTALSQTLVLETRAEEPTPRSVDSSLLLPSEHRRTLLDALKRPGVLIHPNGPLWRIWVVSQRQPSQGHLALAFDVDLPTKPEVSLWHHLGSTLSVFLHASRQREAQAATHKALRAENTYFRDQQRRHYLFKELVTDSPPMRRLYSEIAALVDQPNPVCIEGEAGTGKELLVRALHHLGTRADGLLLAFDCTQVDESLARAQLFGTWRPDGESTLGIFELAAQGTVYLQDIDALSSDLQALVLRVLKEGEIRREGESVGRPVHVRVVVSTRKALEDCVAAGSFRKDLHVAFHGGILHVPPLRAREEDILPLVRVFLQVFSKRYDRPRPEVSPEAATLLRSYPWPGNVRELQRVVEAALLQSQSSVLQPHDFRIFQATP